jgi:Holliday junction resolvase RusA-like endonuclease
MIRRPPASTQRGGDAPKQPLTASTAPQAVGDGYFGVSGVQTLVLRDFPDVKTARTLSPNGRAHWATRKRARERVETLVGVSIFEQRLSDALLGWPVRIVYRWVVPDRRKRDLDNHGTGVVKVVQDCLVRLGMIDADDATCVVEAKTEIVYEKGQRRLEIVLEPAPAAPGRCRSKTDIRGLQGREEARDGG